MRQEKKRPFADRMKAAIGSTERIAGQVLRPVSIEEFLDPVCDQLRFQFWLGNDRERSATYTFTFTSEISIADNLLELEDFVREQSVVATLPPGGPVKSHGATP